MICNDEDTDGRARVTTDEERVLPEDLSQCRDLRIGVTREDFGALTTVRARQF